MVGAWPVGAVAVAFVGGAVVIGIFGSRLVRVVDRLADRTGWGEAMAGAVLLAGANSIAGLVVKWPRRRGRSSASTWRRRCSS